MTNTTSKRTGFYGWKNVIILFIIYMSAMGIVFYGLSVIFPAMIKSLEWNRGTASIALTVGALMMGFIIPLVAYSINKLGPKKTLSIGISIIVMGLFLLGTVMSQIWQWIILWGFIIAIGFSFGGLLPVQTILMYWFNVKRATALGIVMTGAAAGGFLAQPFYTWLISLTNTWKSGWLASAMFALVAFICSFFLVNKPEEVGQHPDGISPDEMKTAFEKTAGGTRTYRTTREWSLSEVLKTSSLYFIIIVIIGHGMPLFFVTTHGILHFTDNGFTGMQAASILSAIILGSGIARFPAGWLGDRIEPRWIFTVTMGAMLIMFMGLWMLTSLNMMVAVGITFGLCYGCQLVMMPTIIGNYYGPEVFPAINGVLAPLLIVFSAVVPVGAGYLFEKNGSYDIPFIILSVIISIGFLFSFFMSPPE